MVKYAFRDKARTQQVNAKDINMENLDTRYYCPNPSCTASMTLKQGTGQDPSGAHFSATRNGGHIKTPYICPYDASVAGVFKTEDYNEKIFDFKRALFALTRPPAPFKRKGYLGFRSPVVNLGMPSHGLSSKASKKKALSTTRVIYAMCKSYSCNDTYNGQRIGEMLFDDRSALMYPNGVPGWKIIECRRVEKGYYNNDRQEIRLEAPLGNPQFVFILKFASKRDFLDMRSSFWENADRPAAVVGNWKSCEQPAIDGWAQYQAIIQSKRQIHLLR